MDTNIFATLSVGARFSGKVNDSVISMMKQSKSKKKDDESSLKSFIKRKRGNSMNETDEVDEENANSPIRSRNEHDETSEEHDNVANDDESELKLVSRHTRRRPRELTQRREEDEVENIDEYQLLRDRLQIQVAGPLQKYSMLTKFSDIYQFLPFPKQQMEIAKRIEKNVEESRFKVPTSIQMQSIPILIQGHDLLGCAPTGSGKTGSFLLPLLLRIEKHKLDNEIFQKMGKFDEVYKQGDIFSIVIAPTRELADQIFREFERFSKGRGFKGCVLRKGMLGAFGLDHANKVKKEAIGKNFSESKSKTNSKSKSKSENDMSTTTNQKKSKDNNEEASEEVSNVKKHDLKLSYDLVVSTPMQLVSFMTKGLNLSKVRVLIFDEVDKLFEMGYIDMMDQIMTSCSHSSVQKSMWSATIPKEVEEMAHSVLREPVTVSVGVKNAGASTIEQNLIFVGEEDGKINAFKRLLDDGELVPPCLIFVENKKRAKSLLEELQIENVRVDAIFSEREQGHRDDVIRNFRLGKTWFLIATDLVARGIDFRAVKTVINFDFPDTAISYVHRIGRTGRAGKQGKAITMFTIRDIENLRMIANVMRLSGCEVPDWMLALKNPKMKPSKLKKKKKRKITTTNNNKSTDLV